MSDSASPVVRAPEAKPTEPFCLLADPDSYVACDWDLTVDHAGRAHWVPFFREHIRTITGAGVAAAVARGEAIESARDRAQACCDEFDRVFLAYEANPAAHGRVTILTLDDWRDNLLRKHGFIDAFIDLKNRENEKMLPLLPKVCRSIDALTDPLDAAHAVIRGVFAGNIFDMGAKATAALFMGNSPDFFQTLDALPKRPWLIDQYDDFSAQLARGYSHCVFFIDNAGSDFLLGALPVMRWLAMRGAKITLAANEHPTLNDMTVHDVRAWWDRILDVEPSLARLPIQLVSTGTAEPLIDLSLVSAELNRASAGADLVVIEGMGRGVESNLNARFRCDAANLAMLKDEAVAARHGGKVFDVVCRFRKGES